MVRPGERRRWQRSFVGEEKHGNGNARDLEDGGRHGDGAHAEVLSLPFPLPPPLIFTHSYLRSSHLFLSLLSGPGRARESTMPWKVVGSSALSVVGRSSRCNTLTCSSVGLVPVRHQDREADAAVYFRASQASLMVRLVSSLAVTIATCPPPPLNN